MAGQVYFLQILLLATLVSFDHAAQILGVFPIPSKSHNNINLSLMRELVAKGHQVTVVGYFPQEPPLFNYTDIILKNTLEESFAGKQDFLSLQDTHSIQRNLLAMDFATVFTELTLQDPKVQQLIHARNLQFELIIMPAFYNEALLGFAHKFKAPIVGVSPYGGTHLVGYVVGNPSPYAHVPNVFKDYTDHMSFFQRLDNTISGTIECLIHKFYHIPKHDAIMKKYFNYSDSIPDVTQLEAAVSLLLVNQDVSLTYPKALVPNMVLIGGMHIKPSKTLPQDLQKYMDAATDGVIYFSLGSFLQSSKLPEVKRKAFLEVFSKLKQRVLFKWEVDTLPGKPDNVRISKWFPQSDILGHPNLRLFITHGGLLSTEEAVYHGIPVVGIPMFGDQNLNMARAEMAGYALKLDYNNITVDHLFWTINQILQQPSYRANAKRLSRLFRDQPQSPMERAIYWTEYVMRHSGAHHLRSAALDLTWYQYLLLDVLAALLLGVLTLLAVTYLVLRTVVRRCTKQSKEHKTMASKKTR